MPDTTGVYECTLETGPDTTLLYTIAIPRQYDPRRPVPLILALHYGWDMRAAPPPFYGKGVLLGLVLPALAELGAVIIAPDCPGRDWADSASEDAVMALLENTLANYPIDESKTLVTGYSYGGMGTWYMAAGHPDLFSAAIPIAGWPPEGAVGRIEDIPLYVLHSRHDEVIPIEPTESAVHQLRARGVPVEFVVVEGITHFQTMRFVGHLRETVPWIRSMWAER